VSFFSNPQKTEGNRRQVVVSDTEIYDLLSKILRELQKMNIQLELLTDDQVTNEEIE